MERSTDSQRGGPTRRAFLSASAATAVVAPLVTGKVAHATSSSVAPVNRREPDQALRALLRQIDPDRMRATVQRLTEFGTRHTASSQTDPVRGIGAATDWVIGQMQAIAAASNGAMTVQRQSFVQPVSSRIPVPTQITNCIATLNGTASPERFYVVTGHLDSRVTDVLDFTSDAPGADDDGSGVAVVLELARLFAGQQFPGTLVFATVAGEEQGLYGSAFMARQMKAAGADVQGMFSNDIVGASQAWDGTQPDPHTLRLFVEGIPTAATPAQISLMQSVGGENDGATHQLARFVAQSATFDLTGINVRVVWRRDRFLRGSDHLSFQQQGYPAARFTEPRENFDHEHQNTQVVDGVQFGDLIDFVDFDYMARVAKVNAAALWSLATAPGTPKGVQIHTTPPGTLSGTNLTSLSWTANPETDLAGYEVVMRETTESDWTSAIDVGDVTAVTLDISKDNVQFGIRAVDQDGRRSPVGFPQAAA
ncbi:MAG TPA: M28 family metallopeptidase [Actinocrinis sp.]|uniref:M28 family metallopeptidase n=1 Tax=Actinocrinis sp. TaxID=1920516 RepID=UPI002DDD90EA|nr:M28 family metallopeptidase [Actinocrinis sp.]HEV2342575.1 M28 family metallopeptidase [Actinocrinis sp.]